MADPDGPALRGPVPAWTADPLHVEGDDPRLHGLAVLEARYGDGIDGYASGPWRVRAGWLVVAALLGLAAGLLVPR